VKKSPKIKPNPFFGQNNSKTLAVGKSSYKTWYISAIFNKLPKVNNLLLGENLPNLVTLTYSKDNG
jgi:hypothetical protein